MPHIEVEIVRFTDEAFPGLVECKLTDAYGRHHVFVEKVPVVSQQDITSSSTLPVAGHFRCEIECELKDPSGRTLVCVNTSRPDGIESTAGKAKFELLPWQVLR